MDQYQRTYLDVCIVISTFVRYKKPSAKNGFVRRTSSPRSRNEHLTSTCNKTL